MAQRTGGKLNAGNSLVRDMAAQDRTVLAVCVQRFARKESGFGQCRVDGRAGVPLAQEEPVALGIPGTRSVDVQDATVQDSDDVGHRKRGSNVRAAAAVGHVERVDSDATR